MVPGAVLAQVWPLLAFLGLLVAAALAYAVRSGDGVPLELSWGLFLLAGPGVVGSFVLHEGAHVVALRGAPGVTHVAVERTLLRISVVPIGDLSPNRAAGVAAAGPGACVLVGAALWAGGVPAAWCWCYLAHGAMLLPVFGDGRTLVRSLALRSSRSRRPLRAAWRRSAGRRSPRAPRASGAPGASRAGHPVRPPTRRPRS